MSSSTSINKGSRVLSIAMTTYNGVRFLREQLDSLFTQTLPPDEVVVCDDGSTDGTVDLLMAYREEEPRLKVYLNGQGLGVNENFLKALSLCSGDWVLLCDQDDIWLPEKIAVSLRTMQVQLEQQGKGDDTPFLVSSRAIPVDEQGRPLGTVSPLEDCSGGKRTILGHASQGCTLMLNRAMVQQALSFPQPKADELLDPLTGRRVVYFDWMIGLIAAFSGNKYDLGSPLMLYRIHPNNVTADPQFYRGGPLMVRLERALKKTTTGYEAYGLYQTKRKMILAWVLQHCGDAVLPEYRELALSVLRLHDAPTWFGKMKILRQLPKDYPLRLKILVALKWLRRRH